MKLTRKIFSIFLAAAMLLSVAVVPATAADSDFNMSDGSDQPSVPETPATPTTPTLIVTGCSDWAVPYISSALRKDIVPGWLQVQYTQDITRAEMCNLIVKLLYKTDVKLPTTYESPFTDGSQAVVYDGTISFVNDIAVAANLGIVNGVTPTTFNRDGKITREQAATMLTRLAKLTDLSAGQQVSFADKGSFSSWAAEGIQFISGLKDPTTGEAVMSGTSSTAFSPRGNLTREQAITTMLRLANCLGIE